MLSSTMVQIHQFTKMPKKSLNMLGLSLESTSTTPLEIGRRTAKTKKLLSPIRNQLASSLPLPLNNMFPHSRGSSKITLKKKKKCPSFQFLCLNISLLLMEAALDKGNSELLLEEQKNQVPKSRK